MGGLWRFLWGWTSLAIRRGRVCVGDGLTASVALSSSPVAAVGLSSSLVGSVALSDGVSECP